MMKQIEIDILTGNESSRDFTAEESAQITQWKEIEKSVQTKETARINAKNSLVEKLGLTADEAALL